jgi:hypothetical protein
MSEVSVLRVGALAVALLSLLLAGCGTVPAGAGADYPGASATPTFWGTYGPSGVQLIGVHVGSSGRILAVAAQMPAGPYGCERDLTASVAGFTAKVAYLSILFQSRLADVAGACRWRVMTVHVSLPAPLGQREVMINSDTTTVFAPSHGGQLRRCGEYGCGPFKPPPPASCTTASYQQAMLSTGPAAGAVYGVLGCDGRWLVLNVGWPGGPAGCDGSSCSPDLVSTRWFFRASRHGWETITAARTAGCAQVHKVEPQFPSRLCAGLPALG